jgi:ABC-type branched-subunit amino acid transport system ATPase component
MLAVEGLVAGYRGGRVLQGVTLAVGPGEVVALVGRNGMGKSTLLRTLMGLVPAGGSMRLDGVEMLGRPPHEIARAGVGWVPQGRQVFAGLTVAENLRLGARGGDPPQALLASFPVLAERGRQRAGSLSGGEQQQLALARALAGRPRLLLLDEPSEGVQPSLVDRIGDTIGRIALGGIGVLLVEQNLDLVREVAGRVLVMEKGRIVAAHEAAAARELGLLERHLLV